MDLRSRIRGAMLGTLVGDSLGGPLEGANPGAELSAQVDARLASPRHIGFTDDTAMTFALAEAVVEGFTPDVFFQRLAANFEPARGFGKGTRRAIEAFGRGETAVEIAASSWSEGSRGNGAAVRVAPIAARHWSNVEDLAAHASASAVPTSH